MASAREGRTIHYGPNQWDLEAVPQVSNLLTVDEAGDPMKVNDVRCGRKVLVRIEPAEFISAEDRVRS
ncbi:MAG: hypothetical protein JWO20_1539 [Candidatus Angelobacter sp.]|nr:hypothetical protein [Candidatus Angelobacter sp.]